MLNRRKRGNPVTDVSGNIASTTAEFDTAVNALRVDTEHNIDFVRNFFGIGGRVVVPRNEIHVVSGTGISILQLDPDTRTYGAGYDSNVYWRNKLTQVIGLSTRSFRVPVSGIQAIDSNNTPFTIEAFCQAALSQSNALVAAEKVGQNTTGLVQTVQSVTSAALAHAATQMDLREIVRNRESLAAKARDSVATHLASIGYNLDLLSITGLSGEAVVRWQQQATAVISRDATERTNEAQVAEADDVAKRSQREAEIASLQHIYVNGQEQTSEEAVRIRTHDLEMSQIDREREEERRRKDVAKEQVGLQEQVDLASTENKARVRRMEAGQQADLDAYQAEREAELAAARHTRSADLELARTEAEANRLTAEQQKELERHAARTMAEAERLRNEEAARANRESEVRRIGAEAEAKAIQIDADAQAHRMRTTAKAEADAATEQAEAKRVLAQARIGEADATRAEEAATGLAQAEVAERQAAVAIKEADAEKARGLAEAEVTEARARADAEARRLEAEIFAQYPQLIELRKITIQHDHEARLATIMAEARTEQLKAIAANMSIRAYGSSTQMSALVNQLLMLDNDREVLSEELPILGQLLGGVVNGAGPAMGTLLKSLNPRALAIMPIGDLMEKLVEISNGEASLVELRDAVRVSTVANLPVMEIVQNVVSALPSNGDGEGVAEDVEIAPVQ